MESKELINLLKDYKKIITIEEHSIRNGFNSFIVDLLVKNKIFLEIDYLGLEHKHISLVGDQKYLREKFSLNKDSLLKKIKY